MGCLSRVEGVVDAISDVDPIKLASACKAIRTFFEYRGFREIVLSPVDSHIVGHPGAIQPFKFGQPRFNTEPEIWRAWDGENPFFSISYLFRNEPVYNALRKPAFQVVDFYQKSSNNELVALFQQLLQFLLVEGFLTDMAKLPTVRTRFDRSIDGPMAVAFNRPYIARTFGYVADEAFFEIDENGNCTREELFLVTEQGFLELAGMGCTGQNENTQYKLTADTADIKPPTGLSGLGFGLERLMLCDQVLSGRANERFNFGHRAAFG